MLDRFIERPGYSSRRDVRRQRRDELYRCGMTESEYEAFIELELQRVEDGANKIDDLDIPNRQYQALRRAGIRTVDGLCEIFEEGRRPFMIGQKSLMVVASALDRYKRGDIRVGIRTRND